MQFFVEPGSDDEWFEYWKARRLALGTESLGIRPGEAPLPLPHAPQGAGPLPYAKAAVDIEYEYPFGWKEYEGIHNARTFDLGRHQEYSREAAGVYHRLGGGKRFVPSWWKLRWGWIVRSW